MTTAEWAKVRLTRLAKSNVIALLSGSVCVHLGRLFGNLPGQQASSFSFSSSSSSYSCYSRDYLQIIKD